MSNLPCSHLLPKNKIIVINMLMLNICVCGEQTPLLLEINTNRSKLKDVVEKIIKAKLGMNLPLIMNASSLLYEAGDVEEDMVAIYEANLEKVSSLSSG